MTLWKWTNIFHALQVVLEVFALQQEKKPFSCHQMVQNYQRAKDLLKLLN